MQEFKLEEINYDIFECPDKKFTQEARDEIERILTIRRDGNMILLCHPRHVFDAVSEDFDTKVIEKVDWNSINIEKMEKYNDYGEYSMVDQICNRNNNQFTYLRKRVRKMMKKYKNLGAERFAYPLAIIEAVYDFSKNDYDYYARGIICATQNGFAFGSSPSYSHIEIKESVWQKSLRMGDNE